MQILRQETGKGHVKHIYSQPNQIQMKHLSKCSGRKAKATEEEIQATLICNLIKI